MRLKTIFICQSCAAQSPKWVGKCPQCNAWNSLIEDTIRTDSPAKERQHRSLQTPTPTPLSETLTNVERTPTGIQEFDRVLGGGLVNGSLLLLGGEPGIGKSTLTLELCEGISKSKSKILYISGEESVAQIALRAKRLGIRSEKLLLVNETFLEPILALLNDQKPDFVILDSIQVMSTENAEGMAGGITQVRACAEALMEHVKSKNMSLLIVSHVTKDGNLAGPKTLEHLVDTVLYLEGDRYHDLRLLRGVKNRFGSTQEVGIFEMTEAGLKEVSNPSQMLLKHRPNNPLGSCLTVTLEGTRPLLVEIQALTHATSFGYPKRATSGFDLTRLELLIAVLQKHAGLNLGNQDVYINVVGGLKIKDPSVDLAVCLAIASSFYKKPLSQDLTAFGEIGLSGEIREGNQHKKRLHEAKQWSSQILVPGKINTLKEMLGML